LSQTVTGNLSSCVLNAPSTFTVFSNNSIYIATIPGFENYYESGFSAPGEFYKMDARSKLVNLLYARSTIKFIEYYNVMCCILEH